MNIPRKDYKNGFKQNTGYATVTVPSTPDADKGKGPAQTDRKGDGARPAMQPPGTQDSVKRNSGEAKPGLHAAGETASKDKSGGESMVNEGGHATPDRTHDADSATGADTRPAKRYTDKQTDKSDLSAKPAN